MKSLNLNFVLIVVAFLASKCETSNFVATNEWQDIQEGQKVPAGLHYRMNLATGKKEAKLLVEENDAESDTVKVVTSPVLSDQNVVEDDEPSEQISPERIQEMKDVLEKLKQNKDIDNIKHLMANYDNSTLEEKLTILEDLDYYMHQIDNAQDFVTLNGLNKIILPALRSSEEDLVAKGAIVLGSASQANTKVQNAVIDTDIPKVISEQLLKTTSSSKTIRRLIFAFSALTRGNANCVENFKVLGGFKILQKSLEDRISETDLVLKGLSLVSDLMSNEATNQVLKLDKSWCALQGSEGLYGQTSDLDHIERLVQSLGTLHEFCETLMTEGPEENKYIKKWLKSSRYKLFKNKDDSVDFKSTIDIINKLLDTLKDEKISPERAKVMNDVLEKLKQQNNDEL